MDQVKQLILQGKTEKIGKVIKVQLEFVKSKKSTVKPLEKHSTTKSEKRLEGLLNKK